MIKKILIANRGEIAVRVIKACRELGITSAAVYSTEDENSLHVRMADEAYLIGAAPAGESYLNIEKIINKAKEINADAIHPGYGFLSENAKFIEEVEKTEIKFIGPPSKSVSVMGEKTLARNLMLKNGVPIVPGTTKPVESAEEAIKFADEVGYPVMLKAAAGGGGKGMRKVDNAKNLPEALERAQNEALKAFSNNAVYLEKFIVDPKHIEVQVIGDTHGNYAHLFERECSVQRRHQKIIEEAPSASVDDVTRKKLTDAAVEAAKACGYYNAGTIEFLMDKDKNFYFLEMNTRLQVEHPVTEMITGIDLVKEQINVALGNKLSFTQEDVSINGHAIEARVYAEDADNNFAPSIGQIKHHRMSSGPGIRIDRGIDVMSKVSVYYDPLLSKVIAWGKSRNEAIERLKRSLGEYQITGVITNIPMCRWVLENNSFIDGSFTINFIDKEFLPLIPDKWHSDGNGIYEEAVSILAALLKNKDKELIPVKRECTPENKWISLRYE